MKKCKSCRKEKPITEYYKGAKNKDGYRTKCKRCCIDSSIENNAKNPNTNEYLKKYRSKESVKEKRRDYRSENIDKITTTKAEYYSDNKLNIKLKRLMNDKE